ncbi:MAG: M56 family metallopeptidase, partial [Nannocystaceae bacterium]
MAWTGDRWLRARPQMASVVWKTALVGGALTASLQVGGAVEPLLGYLHMAPETVVETPVQAMSEAASPSQRVAAIEPAQIVREGTRDHEIVGTPHTNNNVYAASVTAAPVAGVHEMSAPDAGSEAVVSAATPYNWRHLAMGIWALGGLLGLIRIARSWRGLSHQLRGRRTILGSQVRRTFDELCLAAGCPGAVRLTSTHRIDVPLAMGVARPEVCVPRRALGGALDADAQESLLAHELAHVVHRDPLWRLLGAAFEGLLFFQPLNRVANRKLGTYAEYLADEWAVSHTRQPLVLARCLTEVAGWVIAPASRRPVPAMASGKPSVLSQ